MASFFLLDRTLPCPWAVSDLKIIQTVYSRKYSFTMIMFVTGWISSWVFHMGNQSTPRGCFPFWSMNSIYDRKWYSWVGVFILVFSLFQRGALTSGSAWGWFSICSRGLQQGGYSQTWDLLPSHMLKDIHRTAALLHRVWFCSVSHYQLNHHELVTLFTDSAVFRRCRWE